MALTELPWGVGQLSRRFKINIVAAAGCTFLIYLIVATHTFSGLVSLSSLKSTDGPLPESQPL